ncbi:uncharacterized protein MKK02DRAFT_33989 [Dioszegia hungarica]|uniref:Cyclin-dependent kinases regulatory subunit n=1 Tax=Dioszegia hungarica TaxID=4972 RepID=A0AA38HB15_9TREE|nr:uncharacterized protein MKK02DRAFT_33989 [Dioszegia hungarica]KAI9636907.1 hypothetical protein MKK02DRAFT_33989 [Dioszegia hungarica]
MSKYTQKPYSADEKRKAVEQFAEKISYSPRYSSTCIAVSPSGTAPHVILPKQLLRFCPPGVCSEETWRALGIRQSPGWEMYMRHDPAAAPRPMLSANRIGRDREDRGGGGVQGRRAIGGVGIWERSWAWGVRMSQRRRSHWVPFYS